MTPRMSRHRVFRYGHSWSVSRSMFGFARAALFTGSLSGNAVLMVENFDGQWSLNPATVVERMAKQ